MRVKTIEWRSNRVWLIDQRLLPVKEEYRVCRNYRDVERAIRTMVVRGAPAIGVTAAMGVALGAIGVRRERDLSSVMERVFEVLGKARPTAVNLAWALKRMRRVYDEVKQGSLDNVKKRLKDEALRIYEEDIAANRALGALGLVRSV